MSTRLDISIGNDAIPAFSDGYSWAFFINGETVSFPYNALPFTLTDDYKADRALVEKYAGNAR